MTSAQFLEVAKQVAAQRGDLLRTNTFATCAEFCRLTAVAINAAYPEAAAGLLSKSGGERGYTWPNGVRTSHDVIAFPDGRRVDVLGNASDGEIAQGGKGGVASVQWGEVPPSEWRPNNVWVPVANVGGGGAQPGGGGGTTTPPPQTCAYDKAAVAKLTQDVNSLRNDIAHYREALDAVIAMASRMDQKWAERVWNALDPEQQKPPTVEVDFPTYSGKVLGQRFTLTPNK